MALAPPPTTPYADFCVAVRVPLSPLSPVFRDTTQISRGKFDRLQHTTAGSTLCALDGCGLRSAEPARPALTPHTRFLFIGSCLCSTLLSDGSSRQPPLRFASPSVPSTWAKDFHLLAIEHARHNRDRGEPRGSAPPTPPCMRFRTRRFGWLNTSAIERWTARSCRSGFRLPPSPQALWSLSYTL
jgi:hypothetical protein